MQLPARAGFRLGGKGVTQWVRFARSGPRPAADARIR